MGGPNDRDAAAWAALGLGVHLLIDTHDGAEGGVTIAERIFEQNNTRTWGAINCETNCGDHTVRRMLEEADDLNQFVAFADRRLYGRAGSFCMGNWSLVSIDRWLWCLF